MILSKRSGRSARSRPSAPPQGDSVRAARRSATMPAHGRIPPLHHCGAAGDGRDGGHDPRRRDHRASVSRDPRLVRHSRHRSARNDRNRAGAGVLPLDLAIPDALTCVPPHLLIAILDSLLFRRLIARNRLEAIIRRGPKRLHHLCALLEPRSEVGDPREGEDVHRRSRPRRPTDARGPDRAAVRLRHDHVRPRVRDPGDPRRHQAARTRRPSVPYRGLSCRSPRTRRSGR
jgi:hypothetical protein